MHLPTPVLLASLFFTSTLASSSTITATGFNFGSPTTTSTASFNFGDANTILDGFTVTTSGYSSGETAEPKGEWTLDIHPHNTECFFGTDSYTYSSSHSYCFPHGGKSIYFHNKYKPNCTASTFSGRNCRGSSMADLRSDLCNWVTFGSVNVTCT